MTNIDHLRHLRRTTTASALAIIIALSTGEALAQQRRSYDIPAQSLSAAILEFSRQSDMVITIPADLAKGRTSRPVRGTLTEEEGLAQLLAGTGLRARPGQNGGMVVERVETGTEKDAAAMGELDAGQGPAGAASAEGDDREIVVTGSIIRGAAPSGANLIVLGREDLDNTGRGTLAEALQTVPQVHGGGQNDATTRTGIGAAPNNFGSSGGAYGVSSLNLRGLGVEETLTLVNGRRLAPAGYSGAIGDISALPMAAVERVEILADGASATYGADAMAGVVNIIMNRRFEGAETRLRVGLETRSGQPEFQASQTFGWAFDRGNILLSADYAWRDGITAKGRPYAASADLRPFGGSDHRQDQCSPGNIYDSTDDLIGAIPAGQDGRTLTPDQILVEQTNRCDKYSNSSHLTPEAEKVSLYFAGSYDVTDRLRLSTDVIATHRRTTYVADYTQSTLVVPTSNAFRQMNGFHGDTAPLNEPISIGYQFTELGPSTSIDVARTFLASAGADYRLGGDWELGFYGIYSRYDNRTKYRSPDFRTNGALDRALASSDPATAFNPFGDGTANSRALMESLYVPFHIIQESENRSASLSLSGSLLELPGGALKLAFGGEYRRERFKTQDRILYPDLAPAFSGSTFKPDRDVAAAFAELFVPLFTERNAVAGARLLSVSLSGRYDHYSDFGGTFNPKAGVTWVPIEGVTFKGSYGTSFKAPLLRSLYGTTVVSFARLPGGSNAPDVDGDGLTRTAFFSGGNRELGPEEGKSWTVGVEIAPPALPAFRLHATYFNLHFSGRFANAIGWQRVFAEPAAYLDIAYFPMPTRTQIDNRIASVDIVSGSIPPAGSIEAIIDARTLNLASQVMDGVDAGSSYEWDALGGTFNLSADVSYLARYKSRLGQSVTVSSYLNNVGLPPRWKARGGLGWTGDGISLNASVNHMGSYMNKTVTPHEPVSSYTTIDLSAQVQFGGWARGLVGDGASLAIYVTNLFDQAPPFVNNSYGVGYDGANADPIGRRLAVQLTKRW